jgi:hypothetical protein
MRKLISLVLLAASLSTLALACVPNTVPAASFEPRTNIQPPRLGVDAPGAVR